LADAVIVVVILGSSDVVTTAVALLTVGGGASAQRVSEPDVDDVDDRLVHKDDGDENGEALFREASDVADERAEIEGDRHQQKNCYPDANPQTKRQKVDIVLST